MFTVRSANYGPRTNIVVDNQKETSRQNNHLISTPFKIMYIMADLSLEDRYCNLWIISTGCVKQF